MSWPPTGATIVMLRTPVNILPRAWFSGRIALGSALGMVCAAIVYAALTRVPTAMGEAGAREPVNTVTALVLVIGMPLGAIAGAYWVLTAGEWFRADRTRSPL